MRIIIDDIEAAGRSLTPFGREVVLPTARRLKESCITFAAVHRWQWTSHNDFASWAVQQMDTSLTWIILDPLFPSSSKNGDTLRVRMTRKLAESHLALASPDIITQQYQLQRLYGRLVGILDDAASSGITLSHITDILCGVGARPHEILTCSSTFAARRAVSEHLHCRWLDFVPGDCSTIHMRDICPFLPFTGRQDHNRSIIETAQGPVTPSLPVIAPIFRGLWQHVMADAYMQAAVVGARVEVVRRLSSLLGRPATVKDVPLLGATVTLPLLPFQEASASTRLDNILL